MSTPADPPHGEQLDLLALADAEPPTLTAPVVDEPAVIDQAEADPADTTVDTAKARAPGAGSEPGRGRPVERGEAGQLVLLGEAAPASSRGRAGAVPSEVWTALLAHQATRARYQAKIHVRGAKECWFWLGAISDTGHGKLKASRAGGPSVVVTAHAYGYQAANGIIAPRPGEDLVIGHRCDESSCQNPAHWELIERAQNDADYRVRRWRRSGPLADVRGAHGRAVAVRAAILAALAEGQDVEAAIAEASAAGLASVEGLF